MVSEYARKLARSQIADKAMGHEKDSHIIHETPGRQTN